MTYRMDKFVTRNGTGVAAALVTLIALFGATAFFLAELAKHRQRDAAIREIQRQLALDEMQDG